jgi:CRP/FNR family transcriptional regulator, cyclic AMP receptor protein
MADKGRASVDPRSSFARVEGGRNKSRSRKGRSGAQAAPAQRRPSFDTKAFLGRVGGGQSIGKYRKGQVVFSQGDAAEAVFYLQEGKAKLTVVSEQGKEAVIAILGADEFFGEGRLAGQSQRIATVTAMTDSVIARLEKAAIIQVIHQEPAFSEKFIAHLLSRSIRIEADLAVC